MGGLIEFGDYYLYVLGRKPSTTRQQVYRLRGWEQITGKEIKDISANDVLWYLRDNPMNHTGNTRKGMLSAIQAFHRYEVAMGCKDLNGISQIGTPSIRDEDSPPPLELRYVRPLMAACSRPLEYRVIFPGLYAGLRIGESSELHGSMWKGDVLWIKGEKTNRLRPIPIHPRLHEKMWDILASPPTDASTLQRVKRRLEERTGIDFVAHQLRKRFAQSLRDEGIDKVRVAELLGHRTVTDLYAPEPNLSQLRADVLKLPY